MAFNRRSKNITQGIARSPNRSMYYALGYKEEDFDKPMIGIANGHSTITPCNSGLQKLADAAIESIRKSDANPQIFGTPTICGFASDLRIDSMAASDANPQIFGTPTISDGMSMGTEGMKYSLVSREVIANLR